MNEKQEKQISEIGSVKTVEEFDILLEKYKVQNPEKYAVKEASGEFTAFRNSLPSVGKKTVESPKVEETKEEEKAEAPKKSRGKAKTEEVKAEDK